MRHRLKKTAMTLVGYKILDTSKVLENEKVQRGF
jgi:hypothetical protein